MKPKFCMFGFSKDIDLIDAAGFDCIEMHMHEIMSMSVSEFREMCQKLNDSNLTCEVLDNPIPLDQVIADESFDLDHYRNYLKIGAERATRLGVKYYIFGNGKSRSLPLSGDIESAREKNLHFMQIMADITAKRNITVLIEPLAPLVSNVVHSLPEAIDYIQNIGRQNLGTFIDYRWFVENKHPYSQIDEFVQQIQHVHIDNPDYTFPIRLVPLVDDGHDYSEFFAALKRINYQNIISIEANTFTKYETDLHESLLFLKNMLI